MIPTTPSSSNTRIEQLLRRIGVSSHVFVPVRPEPGAKHDECFTAVKRKIESEGGRALYGWSIWQSPVMVEGEFHAVWESPTGELVDITPKKNGVGQIMFAPDPTATYDGRQVSNVRMPVYRNDVLVERFIEINEAIFEVLNRGERAFQHGTVQIPRDEIEPLLRKRDNLGERISSRQIGPNLPCVCGSSRKLKNCCGK